MNLKYQSKRLELSNELLSMLFLIIKKNFSSFFKWKRLWKNWIGLLKLKYEKKKKKIFYNWIWYNWNIKHLF